MLLRLFGALVAALLASGGAFAQSASVRSVLQPPTPLFGVNINGAIYQTYTFPAASDWFYLAAHGIKTVRLPIAWENIETTLGGTLNATYLSALKTAIAGANSVGIGVIVDLHNSGGYANSSVWGSTVTVAGNSGVAASGVNFLGDGTLTSASFSGLWTKLATALVGLPGVIGYEIMNEPGLNNNILPYGANLLYAPNGFADTITTSGWNNGVPTIAVSSNGPGSNPLGTSYGPSWTLVASGYGGIGQNVTLANVPYTLSCQVEVSTGTLSGFQLNIGSAVGYTTLTTSWQVATLTATPPAGVTNILITPNGFTGAGTVKVANCQLNTGASRSTYVPSTWQPFAQAAITAIRAVDTKTAIYVEGNSVSAYEFPWTSWEIGTQLTGGNLIVSAHQYFDGPVTSGGGGGVYSGTYTSYGITTAAGVQEVSPFVAYLNANDIKGQIGEFGIPNSATDANQTWFIVQNNFLQYLAQNNIPATAWNYTAGAIGGGGLNFNPVSGKDDPRLIANLAVSK